MSATVHTPIDWAAANAASAGRPPRRLVSRAIRAAGGDRAGRVALEIGAGGGADAFGFARHGWTVHAYDTDSSLGLRMAENDKLPGEVIFHEGDVTEVEEFPSADVLYSGYSLPLLGEEGLRQTWPRLVAALRPGGIAAVDVFGPRDSWAERPDIAITDDAALTAMFARFQILDRFVRDEAGRFMDERKHWHVISVLARRRA